MQFRRLRGSQLLRLMQQALPDVHFVCGKGLCQPAYLVQQRQIGGRLLRALRFADRNSRSVFCGMVINGMPGGVIMRSGQGNRFGRGPVGSSVLISRQNLRGRGQQRTPQKRGGSQDGHSTQPARRTIRGTRGGRTCPKRVQSAVTSAIPPPIQANGSKQHLQNQSKKKRKRRTTRTPPLQNDDGCKDVWYSIKQIAEVVNRRGVNSREIYRKFHRRDLMLQRVRRFAQKPTCRAK